MNPNQPIHQQYFGHEHLVVIRPARGWVPFDFRELWAYRELLWVLSTRDIRVRYKQAALGIAWAVLQPLMMMIVFSIVFGRLAGMPADGFPYPVFSYAGLIPWIFFANALSSSANSVVGSSNLVTKVYFPRLIIPLASVGSWLFDILIASMLLLIGMLYYGIGWTWSLLLVFPLTIAVTFIALGVGTWLSALTVSYRDFRYVVPFLVQLWMFATPVVYPASIVPERWRPLVSLNPMAGLVEGFRCAFLGRPVNWTAIGISFGVATLVFVGGVAYFGRVQRRFADVI